MVVSVPDCVRVAVRLGDTLVDVVALIDADTEPVSVAVTDRD